MRKSVTAIMLPAIAILAWSAIVVPASASMLASSGIAEHSSGPVGHSIRVTAHAAPAVAPATSVATKPIVVTTRHELSTTSVKQHAAKAAAPVAKKSSDLQTAQDVLDSLKATYRYLDGVTVTIGKTPGGYQAVSYYTVGKIVISPSHTVSISRILAHEIWHVIDWRDNGHIDWKESVPPKNAADYRK